MDLNPRLRSLSLVFVLFAIQLELSIAKDWFLSAVDRYPYSEAAVYTVLFLIPILAVSIRIPFKTTRTFPISLALRLASGLLAFVGLCFLAIKLTATLPVHLTADSLMGIGLGARTRLLLPIGVDSPMDPSAQGFGSIVRELGLLGAIPAAVMVVIASTASVLLSWASDRQPQAILSIVGLAGIDVLLVLSLHSPAFLTLDSPCRTYAFALSLACVGVGLRSSVSTSSRPAAGASRIVRNWRQLIAAVLVGTLAVLGLDAWASSYLQRSVALAAHRIHSHGRFVPLSGVSQAMQDATVAMEDGRFYSHNGIDWRAIHGALRYDLRLGEIKEGGSTITQQLAKNVYLDDNDRNIFRKFIDIALAVELERSIDKRRILELYLNTIDYGMGQHGIQAASAYYFHKTPAQLTLPEAACLVGIVPDPMQRSLDLRRVLSGQQTALNRVAYFFPRRYTPSDIGRAQSIPLNQLIYPNKDAWDRGATEEIPPSGMV